ncbi:MAG: hypothetical protein V8Q84_07170 [Bilophila sp.]
MNLHAFFRSEVKPTLGCTEPGAVAYAAAVAACHLPDAVLRIRLSMSVAIYKNGRSVGIPGTSGLRGLTLACVLGALGGTRIKGSWRWRASPPKRWRGRKPSLRKAALRKKWCRTSRPCGRR